MGGFSPFRRLALVTVSWPEFYDVFKVLPHRLDQRCIPCNVSFTRLALSGRSSDFLCGARISQTFHAMLALFRLLDFPYSQCHVLCHCFPFFARLARLLKKDFVARLLQAPMVTVRWVQTVAAFGYPSTL